MKTTRLTKIGAVAITIVALLLVVGGRFLFGQQRVQASGVADVFAPSAMPWDCPLRKRPRRC